MNKVKTPYIRFLFKSFRDFFTHLRIVIPPLILALSLVGIILLVIVQMIILKLTNGSLILTSYVRAVVICNFILAVLFVALNIVLFLMVRTYTAGMELGIIRGIVASQKQSWEKTKKSGKFYFPHLLKYYSLKYLLWTTGTVFVWILVGLDLSPKEWNIYKIAMALIAMVVGLLFFYLQPIIALEEKTFIQMLKHSCQFFFRHPLKVIFPFIIIGGTSIVLSYLLVLIVAPFQEKLIQYMLPFIYLMYAGYYVLGIVYRIFLFHCYHFNMKGRQSTG